MTSYCYFRVRCQTNYTEQVKIVGNIPELGCWDTSKAFDLTTNEITYPTWNNKNQLFLNPVSIEFKVIIMRENEVVWESIPNRILEIKHFKSIVFITFNNPDVQVIPIKNKLEESIEKEEKDFSKNFYSLNFEVCFGRDISMNNLEESEENSSFYENTDEDVELKNILLAFENQSDSFDSTDISESLNQLSSILDNLNDCNFLI